MYIARVNKNGQITIPMEICRLMNLKEGDEIVFLERDGKVFIEKAAGTVFEEAQENI